MLIEAGSMISQTNNKSKKIWKKAAVVKSEVLRRAKTGKTENNYENSHSLLLRFIDNKPLDTHTR
jgi:hypothetical protein